MYGNDLRMHGRVIYAFGMETACQQVNPVGSATLSGPVAVVFQVFGNGSGSRVRGVRVQESECIGLAMRVRAGKAWFPGEDVFILNPDPWLT